MAITNTALAQAMSDLIAHWQDFQDEMQAWLAGVEGGGPNSDGRYPITDYLDVTTLVKSPAQLQADVDDIISGAGASATAAAASATAAASSATTATTQAGLATTARVAAETAETNAEAAQAAAESARNTAIAQASAASASATAAEAAQAAAELAEANAEAAAGDITDPGFGAVMYWNDSLNQPEWINENEVVWTSVANVFTSAGNTISHATPRWTFDETDASANERTWGMRTTGGTFRLFTATDAAPSTAVAEAIIVDRNGTTVTEIELNATALDFNATLDLSGAAVLNSTLAVTGTITHAGVYSATQSNAGSVVHTMANSSTGSSALVGLNLTNSANTLFLRLLSTGFSGTHLTGGPAGEVAMLATTAAIPLAFGTNNTARLVIDSSGNLDFKAGTVTTTGSSASEVGFKGMPQVDISGDTTLSSAHNGKVLHVTSGNLTVPPIFQGFHCRIVNNKGGSLTVSQSSTGLYLAGAAAGAPGTRTIADRGVVDINTFSSNGNYILSGTGVS